MGGTTKHMIGYIVAGLVGLLIGLGFFMLVNSHNRLHYRIRRLEGQMYGKRRPSLEPAAVNDRTRVKEMLLGVPTRRDEG